ncbi:MAG: radical SAM protein [Thermodesulfobacteriota bacterium]|nr:radical SAM protein [Thermodesulfobacteriota bacterium]
MGMLNEITSKSKQAAIVASAKYITSYVQKDPQAHFDSMMKGLKTVDSLFSNENQFTNVMQWINDHPGTRVWFSNLMSRNPRQVNTFVKNFLGNCSLKWLEKSKKMGNEYGMCPPYSILISPSMRCNLHCKGCYAADYPHKKSDDMDLDTFDRIIREGKEMGVYFYTILGGEPFMVFDDIYAMAKKHKDCLFQVFTNGTLITEEIAEKIEDASNIVVAFSVNGSREDTDYMRGPGVYDKVLASIDKLRKRRLIYGISLVLTSKNYDTFMSNEFLEFWEKQGVVFGWNFLFMPVGPNPDLSLMPKPEQRINFGEFIKDYRERHPLYIMDFWADAPSIQGCIAGGRRFLHVNNKGDIEPCIFAHYSTHNIHRHTLMEAMQSPFFTFIRMNQPHTDNLLRPCMIIDNPDVWRNACKRYNARPSDLGAENLVDNPEITKGIDRYAKEVAKIADPLWKEKYACKIRDMENRKAGFHEGIDRIEYRLNRFALLEKTKIWVQKNPFYIKSMLESLEFVDKNYGVKKDIQSIIVKKPYKETPALSKEKENTATI